VTSLIWDEMSIVLNVMNIERERESAFDLWHAECDW